MFSVGLSMKQPLSYLMVVTDEEEIQEVTVSLASAKSNSADAVVAAD